MYILKTTGFPKQILFKKTPESTGKRSKFVKAIVEEIERFRTTDRKV